MLHDPRHHGWNLTIGKSACAVGGERRKSTVVVEHQNALSGVLHLLEKRGVNALAFRDLHGPRVFLSFEHDTKKVTRAENDPYVRRGGRTFQRDAAAHARRGRAHNSKPQVTGRGPNSWTP